MDIRTYCVACKTQRIVSGVRRTVLENGTRAVYGICTVCSNKAYRFGRLPVDIIRQLDSEAATEALHRMLSGQSFEVAAGAVVLDEQEVRAVWRRFGQGGFKRAELTVLDLRNQELAPISELYQLEYTQLLGLAQGLAREGVQPEQVPGLIRLLRPAPAGPAPVDNSNVLERIDRLETAMRTMLEARRADSESAVAEATGRIGLDIQAAAENLKREMSNSRSSFERRTSDTLAAAGELRDLVSEAAETTGRDIRSAGASLRSTLADSFAGLEGHLESIEHASRAMREGVTATADSLKAEIMAAAETAFAEARSELEDAVKGARHSASQLDFAHRMLASRIDETRGELTGSIEALAGQLRANAAEQAENAGAARMLLEETVQKLRSEMLASIEAAGMAARKIAEENQSASQRVSGLLVAAADRWASELESARSSLKADMGLLAARTEASLDALRSLRDQSTSELDALNAEVVALNTAVAKMSDGQSAMRTTAVDSIYRIEKQSDDLAEIKTAFAGLEERLARSHRESAQALGDGMMVARSQIETVEVNLDTIQGELVLLNGQVEHAQEAVRAEIARVQAEGFRVTAAENESIKSRLARFADELSGISTRLDSLLVRPEVPQPPAAEAEERLRTMILGIRNSLAGHGEKIAEISTLLEGLQTPDADLAALGAALEESRQTVDELKQTTGHSLKWLESRIGDLADEVKSLAGRPQASGGPDLERRVAELADGMMRHQDVTQQQIDRILAFEQKLLSLLASEPRTPRQLPQPSRRGPTVIVDGPSDASGVRDVASKLWNWNPNPQRVLRSGE